MRWKSMNDRQLPNWVGYPIVVLTFPVWGFLIAIIWLEDVKRRVMGPSSEWRPWFAWHPVYSWDAHKTVWLEWVERRIYWNTVEYGTTTAND